MPHTYCLLRPPYSDTSFVKFTAIPGESVIPRGAVLAVCPDTAGGWPAVIELVAATARSVFRAPVVLWSPGLEVDAIYHLALHGPGAGLRCVVTDPTIDPSKLRKELCDTDLLDRHVVYWLQRRGLAVRPALEDVIARITTAEIAERTIADTLKHCGRSQGSWTRAAHAAGFTRAEDAFQIFRLLRACVEIQVDTGRRVAEIASFNGYFDTAALRASLHDVMGSTPSDIREHLGWEWLLFQALRRAGIQMRRGE